VVEDALETVDLLYRAAVEQQHWPEALERFARAAGCIGVAMIPITPKGRAQSWFQAQARTRNPRICWRAVMLGVARGGRLFFVIALALFAAAAASPAEAAIMNGRDLLNQCDKGKEGGDGDGLCGGYIIGVIDQSGWFDTHLEDARKCLPDGVSIAVVVDIVTTYLAANPDALQSPAPRLVNGAMANALSC
jgi:hypothetical protein